MTLSYTLRSGGEYTYTVTNDQLGFCDPGPNCSESGDFTATGNQITFDPGTVWEEMFSYTITGNTLTISATFDGAVFTFTFQKR